VGKARDYASGTPYMTQIFMLTPCLAYKVILTESDKRSSLSRQNVNFSRKSFVEQAPERYVIIKAFIVVIKTVV
jgi:hypothetical protein